MSRRKKPPRPPIIPTGKIIQISRRGGKTPGSWTKETRAKFRGGRKKGSKDKIPRTLKKSIVMICQDLVDKRPALIRKAFIAGLQARPPSSFPYLQLAAAYLDGTPASRVKIEGEITVQVSQAGQALKTKLEQVAANLAARAVREREAAERAMLPWAQATVDGEIVGG